MMRRNAIALAALGMLMSIFPPAAMADDASCFIKEGDRVGFFGDSITEANVYGTITELVFRHFHPEAKATFINNGGGGRQLAGTGIEVALGGEPNVVTIMMGMNDAMNANWLRGMPIEPKAAEYKANLVKMVRGLKEKGKEVIIFTPTLSDESAEASCFRIDGTEKLLAAMGKACEEVAKEESVHLVPIQSEFESYQDSLPPFAQLRPDGVHPCARGNYQIARSLWTHLSLAGPLDGARVVSPAQPPLDVKVELVSNILPADTESLEFSIATSKPAPATLTWSLGAARGSEPLKLTGKDTFKLTLPKGALPQANGSAVTLVMDIESQGAREVFVVDVFRKMVIHGKEGVASGTIADAKGNELCSYAFKKDGKGLLFTASVTKKELVPSTNEAWPWGNGDAVTLYFDARKGPKLGGLGFDGHVGQVWFRPQDKPTFSPGFHPWSGKHLPNVATVFGEKKAYGYDVGLRLSGSYNLQTPFDVSGNDFFAFDLSVINAEIHGKQVWSGVQKMERYVHIYPGGMTLIDINGKFAGDSALTASVFPDQP